MNASKEFMYPNLFDTLEKHRYEALTIASFSKTIQELISLFNQYKAEGSIIDFTCRTTGYFVYNFEVSETLLETKVYELSWNALEKSLNFIRIVLTKDKVIEE